MITYCKVFWPGLVEGARIVGGLLGCLGEGVGHQISQTSERTVGLGGKGSVLECLSWKKLKSVSWALVLP